MNFFFNKYVPKKCFGQNFIIDEYIINKIIEFINPKKNDLMIEIGPGLGALTNPMCEILDNIIVIELDRELSYFLKYKSIFKDKIKVFNQDANYFNFSEISIKKNQLIRIFGNLPYNISVKLILYFIKFRNYIYDINIMVQYEVAQRLIADIGNKNYGRLTIIIQSYFNVIHGFSILPGSFFPVPKVKSTFIKIIPKNIPLYPFSKIRNLSKITSLAFNKRRKMIKNSLSNFFNVSILLSLGINPCFRAENLSVLQYCRLADYLDKYLN